MAPESERDNKTPRLNNVVTESDVIKTWTLNSAQNFARYFFKVMHGQKFTVNNHHLAIWDTLDRVVKGELTKVIFNVAPRYSKTELVVKQFCAYGFALNPSSKFIHLSYSDDLVKDNSSEVQSIINTNEFQELYDCKLTTTAKGKWKTAQNGGFYAVASGGQVTGFGAGKVDSDNEQEQEIPEEYFPAIHSDFAGALIIDDPIKPDDAQNDKARESVNNKFETTLRNRVNSRKTPIILIMQRLHPNDLAGYLQKHEPGEWHVVEFPCLLQDENGDKRALWPKKHTVEELENMQASNNFVFQTQYQQNPKPREGLMYDRPFRTYEYGAIPATAKKIRKNYTDVADTGKDYLCSICYIETEIGNFIRDIIYTQKAQEYTEPAVAKMLTKHNTKIAVIESNNGGRTFGRNVENQARMDKNTFTQFKYFHQGENKDVRIFTKSNDVMNVTYMPAGWESMFPEFYNAITGYMKTGGNKHDDAPDALTGTYEQIGKNYGGSVIGLF